MVGLATAMVVGCSNPPPAPGNHSGNGTGNGGTGGSASPGNGGTGGSAQAGTGGSAGTGEQTGMAGSAAAGTDGSGTAGTGGTAGTMPIPTAGTGGGTGGTAGTGSGMGCPAGVKGHCNADTGAKDKYPGFTLALAEEFDQAIDLDKDPIWTWSDGGPPEGQARFQKEQITFAGGQMIITAIAKNVPSSTSYAEPDKNKTTGTAMARPVASGEFRTKYNNYRYGRYEVKYQAPLNENMGHTGDGNFLSTMFTFRTPKWKEWRELDLELEANIKTKVAYNMVNANGATAYPGGDAGNMAPMGQANFTIQAFHTYIIEWTPTKVTWIVDGQTLLTNAGSNARPIPTLSAKIMMNLWVFGDGSAFGNPANNTYPFHSTYEYFRFYKWDMETMYPLDDPKQLPTTDTMYSQNNANELTYP
jgi:hypothetical protein